MVHRFIRAFATAIATIAALGLLTPAAAAKKDAKKDAKPEVAAGSIIVVPMVAASIQRANGHRMQLDVDSELDVPDPKLRLRATQSMPRLRDAYLHAMLAYAAAIPAGSAPDPVRVGALLQRAADAVLGRPGARVLLGSTVID